MKRTGIITIFFLFATCAFAQSIAERADSMYTSLYKKGKFNGNVLIAEKGNIVFSKSYGKSNEATGEMLTENSVFELASVSKQFTAMAVMMLREKGKLSLNDSIGKFIPELKFYGNVTVRNLLNHTGGLPDYMEPVYEAAKASNKIADNKVLIAVLAKEKIPAVFKPGEKYEYSNTGYALLSSVVEKVSGMTYKAYLEKNIFNPLGMKNTLVYRRRFAPEKIAGYAYGYVYSDSAKKFILPDQSNETNGVILLDGITGDGTVNSTVIDLLKWDRALYTGKLIPKQNVEQMFIPAVLTNGRSTKYGMGWSVDSTNNCGSFINHSGSWFGYSTYIERHIDNDKVIIILDNHDDRNLPAFATRKIMYGQSLTPRKRSEIVLPAEKLAEYEGEYDLNEEVSIKISLNNGKLKALLTGQNPLDIFAESADNFFLKVVDAQLEFVRNEKGKIFKLILHQNGINQDAYKK